MVMNQKNVEQKNDNGSGVSGIRSSSKTALFVVGGVSIGWLVVISCILDFDTLMSLQPNELGDLLSGVFAPLAFIFLAATTWIQSNELYEQRKEFAYNREVMQAQANEAHIQANSLVRQTEILTQQQKANEQIRANAEFDELVKVLRVYAEKCFQTIQIDPPFSVLPQNGEMDMDFLVKLSLNLRNASLNPVDRQVLIAHYHTSRLQNLVWQMTDLIEMSSKVGLVRARVLDNSEIRDVISEFAQYYGLKTYRNNP